MLIYSDELSFICFLRLYICAQVYVGRFIPRKEREQELGEKAKRFTNIFIKNFGEELSEQDLTDIFAKYGKISSIKVLLMSV